MSEFPAITCPGHDHLTDCEDYPGGSCEACDAAEDARLEREAFKRAFESGQLAGMTDEEASGHAQAVIEQMQRRHA